MSGLQGTETSGALAAIVAAMGEVRIHDVSPVIHDGLPVWWMYEQPVVTPLVRHEEAGSAVNTLSINEHTGTHVDAPFH